ncbi:hypothetical protein B0H15DRAFT_796202 [Mycena belliarum]|uniref:NAD(P)-binding protein n=1 Tax=Mycena belliarum TaxID=1033014 RepID=A0AAD6XWP3_9AGAR|nr:hypothetical protein B0H15DRAFT_796202 [Mycena belliae]
MVSSVLVVAGMKDRSLVLDFCQPFAGVGNGSGTGGAVARLFAKEGYTVALVSRGAEALDALAKSIRTSGGKAESFPVPAYGAEELTAAFASIHARFPAPEYAITAAVFNTAHGAFKPFLDITPEDVRESNKVNIESAFAFSRAAILAFQKNEVTPGTGKKGTLVFTGATASIRGNVVTSAVAAGKFALRALSQSLAKEFGKQDIHLDLGCPRIATGNTRGDRNTPPSGPVENTTPNAKLSPESIAAISERPQSYLYLVKQDQSAMTWELDLRPSHEKW